MTDLERAIETYHTERCTFVLVKDGRVVATGTRSGVGELLEVLAESPDAVCGASLADKIVGKAVAMIAAYAGIVEIYTPMGSETAAAVLNKFQIPFHADRTVPIIQNKHNDGICPMERLTLPISEPEVAVAALKTFVAQSRAPLPVP